MADKQERPNSKKTKQAAEEITSGKHEAIEKFLKG